jgi:hypothetical protein
MFARGSRYRNLPESASLNAGGERAVGKELRIIPRTSGTFIHTVNERDRLDLLAFKYYGDPARWWQISDANPQFPFPIDLLDRGSVVADQLALVDVDNVNRFADLVASVNAIGRTVAQSNSFVAADIIAIYAGAAQRPQLLSAIGHHGFRFLRSYSWIAPGGGIAETFAFEDQQLKLRWRHSIDDLRATAGIVELKSNLAEGTIDVVWNMAMIDRPTIVLKLTKNGLALSPQKSSRAERVGAKIVIPPNGGV